MGNFWFKSSLFEVEPNEDKDTNPRIYGKQLSFWLKDKLNQIGYQITECFPDDWGWCVLCFRKPFMLFVACSSVYDYDNVKEDDPPPNKNDIVWALTVFAEIPFFKRLFGEIDTSKAKTKLESDIEKILADEPEIKIVEESPSIVG